MHEAVRLLFLGTHYCREGLQTDWTRRFANPVLELFEMEVWSCKECVVER